MNSTIAKPTEVRARSDTRLMRVFVRAVGMGCAVWVFSHAIAAMVYMFDGHTHAHPGVDVLVVHGAELVASLLLLAYYGIGWREAGFQLPAEPIRWSANIALVVFLNLALAGIMHLFRTPDTHTAFSPVGKLVLLCVYVPLAEEVFVRGWFQAVLLRGAGETRAVFAVLGSSAFFAAMHVFVGGGPIGTIVTVVGAFLMGLITGHLRQKSGSLLPAIAMHGVYNLTGLFLATPLYSLLANILKR